MNFYFDAAGIIDRLDAKKGSVKSLLGTLPEKSRKRTAALVIAHYTYFTSSIPKPQGQIFNTVFAVNKAK
jgi:hypothetical protein